MCKADGIAAKFKGCIYKRPGILGGACPAFFHGDFFMEGDALEEGLLTVYEDAGAIDGYAAEAYSIGNYIFIRTDADFVEFGIERFPETKFFCFQLEMCNPLLICLCLGLKFKFRDGDIDLNPAEWRSHLHIRRYPVGCAILQPHKVVGHI